MEKQIRKIQMVSRAILHAHFKVGIQFSLKRLLQQGLYLLHYLKIV